MALCTHLVLAAFHCTIILMCLQRDHRLCNGRQIFQDGTMLWKITSVIGERDEEYCVCMQPNSQCVYITVPETELRECDALKLNLLKHANVT